MPMSMSLRNFSRSLIPPAPLILQPSVGRLHHGLDDFVGRALVLTAGKETGGGLYEVRAGLDGDLGRALDFLYGERVDLENDLEG